MTKVVDRRSQDEDALLFICDFTPPRGAAATLLEGALQLGADYVSVAYNPGRTVRANSAFVARWIKDHTASDALFTLATRDMNKIALQSLLLGAELLGLANVVVVKGDEFTERDLRAVSEVDDFRPTELLASIAAMNEGQDYREGALRTNSDLCVGATVDLSRGLEAELGLTRRKVEAGAQFFLLQAIPEPAPVEEFLGAYAERYAEALAAPVFCGVQVMTKESIRFGEIPDWVIRDLDRGRAGDEIAVELTRQFVDRGFNSIYLVPPILRGGRRDYETAAKVIAALRG